jgi:imidazolonepropionase-like amidohydrolase
VVSHLSPPAKTLLRAGKLIWKASAPHRTSASLLIEEGVITAVDDDAEGRADAATVVLDYSRQVVAPGLIDSHVHLVWSGGPERGGRSPLYEAIGMPPERMREQAVRNMRSALDSGVTTVRDCGGIADVIVPLARAVARRELVGPRIVSAGAPITTKGGHCWFLGNEADGDAAVRRAVRGSHENGSDFVKVMVTGGGSTEGSDMRVAQYTQSELDAIVGDAHELGLPVTGHVHGTEGIERAVVAGFDGLEHCSWLARTADGEDYRADLVEQIRDRRVFVCKTIAGFQRWPLEELIAEGRHHEAWDQFGTFREMLDDGVIAIAGTDAGITDTSFSGLSRTLETMVGLGGMSAAAALQSATATAAEALQLSDQVGTLEVGKRGDCIVLDADPLRDIRALRDVKLVIRDGVVLRGGVAVAQDGRVSRA